MRLSSLAAGVVLAVLGTGLANAGSLTPTFQTFDDLPRATFGGNGIPTDPTAFSTFTASNGDQLTLGISATQRFSNPALGNDGAGTYTATPGLNDGTPGSTAGALRATWNFNFFAELTGTGGSTLSDFNIQLLYDLDPGAGTDIANLGILDFNTTPVLTAPGVFLGDLTLVQGSQNLVFGFLAGNPAVAGITPPAFGPFDANALGEYSFALQSDLGDVSINVNVVPLPATAWLLLSAFGGLGLLSRFRRRAFA
ncbi:MAG: VPLPA-CTERM sorting domain-containing protein [Pseudomonadota bacterium]